MYNPLESDKYTLGIESIDQQHDRLLEMIDNLESAMSLGDSRPEVESIIERLYAFAQGHFAYEEDLMLKTDFPGFAAHQEQHRAYLDKILEICHRWADGGGFLIAVDLHEVMTEWATYHILECDQDYVKHLQEKGIT